LRDCQKQQMNAMDGPANGTVRRPYVLEQEG